MPNPSTTADHERCELRLITAELASMWNFPTIAEACEMDEWQLVMMAKVLECCKVKVVSDGLPAETLRKCLVEPAPTVEQAVSASLAEYGPKAKVAVIPKGPSVLPYVAG